VVPGSLEKMARFLFECGVARQRLREQPDFTMKRFLLLVPLVLPLAGCLSIKTHHTVDPIQINVDVNVKVDKALNDFFGDLDKKAGTTP